MLGLTTWENRRLMGCLINAFKVMNGILNLIMMIIIFIVKVLQCLFVEVILIKLKSFQMKSECS